uniref:Uncharacterized protein n=1 Tax=Solanum lycopersicum TaxID=4081 RepID=A0A3Q7G127_SOLLC
MNYGMSLGCLYRGTIKFGFARRMYQRQFIIHMKAIMTFWSYHLGCQMLDLLFKP